MLVPSITQWTPSWTMRNLRLESARMPGAASIDSVEAIPIPGAVISGFIRPSRVGPGLENGASDPIVGMLV